MFLYRLFSPLKTFFSHFFFLFLLSNSFKFKIKKEKSKKILFYTVKNSGETLMVYIFALVILTEPILTIKMTSECRKPSPSGTLPCQCGLLPKMKVFLPLKVFLVSVISVSLAFSEEDLAVHHGCFLVNLLMVTSSSVWSAQSSTVWSCEALAVSMSPTFPLLLLAKLSWSGPFSQIAFPPPFPLFLAQIPASP
jgi:hypothetical protein